MSDVTVRVPAKVNLGLSVGPPGEDGYHKLVNVFHAVSIFDEVTVRRAETFSVVLEGDSVASGAGVPLGDDNLAVRAARLLARHAGVDGGVELRIRKSIPVAGGMAGGSADAAAALVGCDAVLKAGASRETLLSLAAQLGADVAFPLVGGTAVGHGRGELLTPVSSGGTLHWVFALPEGGLAAGAVYAECDRLRQECGERIDGPRASEALMTALYAANPADVGAALHNELQPAVLNLRPDLRRTLDAGREQAALGALVSGSGPTCAFLARSSRHARELAAALEEAGACQTARAAHGPVRGAQLVSGCRADGHET